MTRSLPDLSSAGSADLTYLSLSEDNLEAVHALCNRNLEYDQLPLDIFREKTLEDPDFEPNLAVVAVRGDLPCAFMMAVCRPDGDRVDAGIKIFAVDPEHRNRGIATEMLAAIETGAKARGAELLSVGLTRPDYITPGLDPRYTEAVGFLLRRDFSNRGELFNMAVGLSASDWSSADLEEKLARRGITCRRLRPEEKTLLREWMDSDGCSPGWQYQVMKAADRNPTAVYVAENAGRYVGFACYDGVRPGWFGPMKTNEEYRGLGIGSVTFLKCLQSMKSVGYRRCEICAVGPLYFYSKVANARVSRVFWQFEKVL